MGKKDVYLDRHHSRGDNTVTQNYLKYKHHLECLQEDAEDPCGIGADLYEWAFYYMDDKTWDEMEIRVGDFVKDQLASTLMKFIHSHAIPAIDALMEDHPGLLNDDGYWKQTDGGLHYVRDNKKESFHYHLDSATFCPNCNKAIATVSKTSDDETYGCLKCDHQFNEKELLALSLI